MDKYLVKQQKRKSPDQFSPEKRQKTDEKERKVLAKKQEKAGKKDKKNGESMDVWLGKSSKEEPGTSKKKEEKAPKKDKKETKFPEESEDQKQKNQLRKASELPENVNQVGELLPTMRGKAISDEDLIKLVRALCGDTGKMFDSDDSILSDIDRMNDEEIAEKDARFRRTIEYIDSLPNKLEALRLVLKQGKETKEERDERRKGLRALQSGLKTKEERDRAEEKRAKKVARMEKRMKTIVQIFDGDAERKKKSKVLLPFMSCSQFAGYLELIAEMIPDDGKASEEGGNIDFQAHVKEIDEAMLEKKLKYGPIRGNFYTRDRTVSNYLKKRIRRILGDSDVLDVLDGHRYGFEFSAKDAILVLENYFAMNKPKKDNGSSIKPLEINISKLLRSAFHVTRADNPNFVLNEALKMAMFE